MIVLLLEYRVSDLSDCSQTINSVFLDAPIDLEGLYYLQDVNTFNNLGIIYSIFFSKSLVNILYFYKSTSGVSGDLFHLPSFFNLMALDADRPNLHCLKFNNIVMGSSITFINNSLTDDDPGIMSNIYAKMATSLQSNNFINSSQNNSSNDSNDYSDLDLEQAKIEFPEDSYMKRYDDLTVVYLVPGEINSSVASYILAQTEPYFYDYSKYLQEVSLTIYFFNPISEIYFEATFTYQRSVQGMLSFSNSLRGGFPLLYQSHQFNASLLNFYFAVKILFFIWTIFLFLYKFFTVTDYFF